MPSSTQKLRRVLMKHLVVFVVLGSAHHSTVCSYEWKDINLPPEHMPQFFHNQPDLCEKCLQDEDCPFKSAAEAGKTECWGYEDGCPVEPRLPNCPESSRYWENDKESQRLNFWNTADFGLVRERRDEFRYFCIPEKPDDSSLKCVSYLRYCYATNIFIDFSTANLKTSTNQYREDVLRSGQIGGRCKLQEHILDKHLEHKSFLQSWATELQYFVSVKEHKKCDVTISEPTLVIKLDATVNMFHHFCDYVNMYLSQHFNNSFSTDINILIWDTSGRRMNPMFSITWKAFSNRTPLRINEYDGKTVCLKNAMFSFLARLRGGLYYNMPLIPGCHGSSLMKAFSHHIVHRLQLPQHGPLLNKIRVTLLSRSTQYRRILNEDELIQALKSDFEFEVQRVDFNAHVPFIEQISVSHNSDIFIGMHGAGLTHMLFQPDWAVVMELYNCEDPYCYFDLARLRGIHYLTWEKNDKLHQEDEGHHPQVGAHAKFTNYAFDVEEFMRMMRKAADYVRSHPAYLAAHKNKHSNPDSPQTEADSNTSGHGQPGHSEL